MAISTIDWKPLSEKHLRYINKALKSKMSVAEGAIRCGKTIDNCFIAAMYLMVTKDRIHLASGSTIANAKMNIGDCNGFGLEHLFKGKCRWGKYKDNEALYIQTPTGEKIVIFAGGGKSDSFKKILGNSYGLWIATEINQHYDSDESESSFIKVAFGRQVASSMPKVLWDLNPSSPNHPIYERYIDKWRKEELIGGYNYEHFVIKDNLAISDSRRQEIESQYDKNSVWYHRDILGERCIAEGLIYQTFADHPEQFILRASQVPPLICIDVGIDFGGNGSAHTFVASGFTYNFRDWVVLESKRITDKIDSAELNRHFIDFANNVYNKYSKAFESHYDNAEPVLGRSLANASMKNGCHTILKPALKMNITQRIRLVENLMSQKRFWVMEHCKTVIDALSQAVWDKDHPDERLDDGTSDIDTLDALEYSGEKHHSNLIRFVDSYVREYAEKKENS